MANDFTAETRRRGESAEENKEEKMDFLVFSALISVSPRLRGELVFGLV